MSTLLTPEQLKASLPPGESDAAHVGRVLSEYRSLYERIEKYAWVLDDDPRSADVDDQAADAATVARADAGREYEYGGKTRRKFERAIART